MTSSAPWNRPQLLELRQTGAAFDEIEDLKWVNPREFHRKAVSYIENLGFEVDRGEVEGIEIKKEAIGEKTGIVESWIEGRRQGVVTAEVTWKPYVLVGVATVVMGSLILLFGVSELMPALVLFGGFLAAAGLFAAQFKKKQQFPVRITSRVRLYATGEASERTLTRPGGTVTDLFAQLTVTYAALTDHMVWLQDVPNPQFQNALHKNVVSALSQGPGSGELMKLNPERAAFYPFNGQVSPFTQWMTPDGKALADRWLEATQQDFQTLSKRMNEYRVTIEEASGGPRAQT